MINNKIIEQAMAALPSKVAEIEQSMKRDEDDLSPDVPLPIYQQRDNFFT